MMAVYEGPIIDNHAHVVPAGAGERRAFIDRLVRAMARAGVAKVVLGLNSKHVRHRRVGPAFDAVHDLWVAQACRRHPERIVPSLAGFDPRLPETLDYARKRLATGFWRAIGELDLRNRGKQQRIAADSAVPMGLYRLAARHRVPVSIHYNNDYGTDARSGLGELERAIAANPETVFITAHYVNVKLMEKYPNVWGEYLFPSFLNPSLCGLFRAGKPLSLLYRDHGPLFTRIVVASDVQELSLRRPERPWSVRRTLRRKGLRVRISEGKISYCQGGISYDEIMTGARRELGTLPRAVAENVGCRNLSRLLALR